MINNFCNKRTGSLIIVVAGLILITVGCVRPKTPESTQPSTIPQEGSTPLNTDYFVNDKGEVIYNTDTTGAAGDHNPSFPPLFEGAQRIFPADDNPAQRESYLALVADSFTLTKDAEVAKARLMALKRPGEKDSDLAAMLERAVKALTVAGKIDVAGRLRNLTTLVPGAAKPTVGPTQAGAKPSATPVKTSGGIGSSLLRIFGIVFLLVVAAIAIILLLSQWQKSQSVRRRRVQMPASPSAEPAPPEAEALVEPEAAAMLMSENTLGEFDTTFNLGDVGYDVNYSIESQAGDFLGECGVSALENLAGAPERVTAFEVWLFDKEEVHTETKVLLSAQAFADAALRAKLSTKGQIIQAQEGQVITLSTANLQLDARITELDYEAGSSSAVFSKLGLKLELARRPPAA